MSGAQDHISKSTSSSYPMIDVDDALACVLEQASPLSTATVDLENTSLQSNPGVLLGLRLAENISSPAPVPAFPASIMDGYAVVAADGPGTYSVLNSVTAGDSPQFSISSGTVAYITTGSALPPGSDAVIPVEETEPCGENQVRILNGVQSGKWVRQIGSDMAEGEVVLEKGCRLGSAEVGLLASLGITQVPVYARPCVGILSTGNELVAPSASISGSMIRDSNRSRVGRRLGCGAGPGSMLLAAVTECACKGIDLGIASDSEETLTSRIREAFNKVDILVTSGGVSMGSHDFVKPILKKLGTVHFGRMCMKPGKPTTFATVHHEGSLKYVFALPGNPVSSAVTFKLLVEPCIQRLGGSTVLEAHHTQIQAQLAHKMVLDPTRPEYHRAMLEWVPDSGFVAWSTGVQRSSRLLSMRAASALLLIPKGEGYMERGTMVKALLISQQGGIQLIPPKKVSPHKLESKPVGHMTSSLNPLPPTEDIIAAPKSGCLCCQQKAHSAVPLEEAKPFGGSDVEGTTFLKVGVVTISDRASAGTYEDRGGPQVLRSLGSIMTSSWRAERRVIPDERAQIVQTLKTLIDDEDCAIVITTGGTGPAVRDVTPDATRDVIERELPGFGERMRAISLEYVPTAILSRQIAGTYKSSVILNLPGSPGSIQQILPRVFDALGYCIQLLRSGFSIQWESHQHPTVAPPQDGRKTPQDDRKAPTLQSLTVDVVNLEWLKKTAAELQASLSEVLNSTICIAKSADEEFVFTKVRGADRKKKKVEAACSLDESATEFLQRMTSKYKIADTQKAARIVLDYALEEPSMVERLQAAKKKSAKLRKA